MANLEGKVALVTGGSRGIGAATALRLAEDGADVAFSYVSSEGKANDLVRRIKSLGKRAIAFKADSAVPEQVAGFVTTAHSKLGRIDILVNSAGLSITGSVDDPEANTAEFDRQFAVNVKGVATAVRTAVPLMSDGGSIVTIGSVFGTRTALAGFGDYAASKAAVAAYTRAWSRDLGMRRITVNIVQPGPIDTDMNPADSDHAPTLAHMTALGRYGRDTEISSVVAFLVSSEASYITGATIDVDGGLLA